MGVDEKMVEKMVDFSYGFNVLASIKTANLSFN